MPDHARARRMPRAPAGGPSASPRLGSSRQAASSEASSRPSASWPAGARRAARRRRSTSATSVTTRPNQNVSAMATREGLVDAGHDLVDDALELWDRGQLVREAGAAHLRDVATGRCSRTRPPWRPARAGTPACTRLGCRREANDSAKIVPTMARPDRAADLTEEDQVAGRDTEPAEGHGGLDDDGEDGQRGSDAQADEEHPGPQDGRVRARHAGS